MRAGEKEFIPKGKPNISGRERTRRMVRARDNHTCQMCGKVWVDGMRRFDVHHLNGMCGKNSRGYDSPRDLDTMITLCHKCHFSHEEFSQKLIHKR